MNTRDQFRATGHYRVEFVDGKHGLITPLGELFMRFDEHEHAVIAASEMNRGRLRVVT